jgi:hypothetical protein
MKTPMRFIRDTCAATALEFALISPVLVAVIFGTIEVGRFAFAHNSMDAALAKAGREWMLDPDFATSELESIFCARTHLVDCAEAEFTITTVSVDGQAWRIIRADTAFVSPLYPLLPLPTTISVTEQVPIFSD